MTESRREEREPDTLSHALRELMRASHEATIAMAARLELGVNDLAALDLLDLEGAMGPVELGARLGMRSASATALVDRLERAGHIERQRDSADRRRVTVTPTAHALEASMRGLMPLLAGLDAAARGLSPEERALVERYLRDVTQALRASVS